MDTNVLVMSGCGSIALYTIALAVAAKASRVSSENKSAARLATTGATACAWSGGRRRHPVARHPLDDLGRSMFVSRRCRSQCRFDTCESGIHFNAGPGRGFPDVAVALSIIGHVDPSPATGGGTAFGKAAAVLPPQSRSTVFIR